MLLHLQTVYSYVLFFVNSFLIINHFEIFLGVYDRCQKAGMCFFVVRAGVINLRDSQDVRLEWRVKVHCDNT